MALQMYFFPNKMTADLNSSYCGFHSALPGPEGHCPPPLGSVPGGPEMGQPSLRDPVYGPIHPQKDFKVGSSSLGITKKCASSTIFQISFFVTLFSAFCGQLMKYAKYKEKNQSIIYHHQQISFYYFDIL